MLGVLHHFTELFKVYLLGFTKAVRILCPVGLFRMFFRLFLIFCVTVCPKPIRQSALRVAQMNTFYSIHS